MPTVFESDKVEKITRDFSAKHAKSIADEYTSNENHKNLLKILNRIYELAKCGYYSYKIMQEGVFDENIIELEKLGYKICPFYCYSDDIHFFIISW